MITFRMNERQIPIEVQRNLSVYSLERMLVEINSLDFRVLVETRHLAYVHWDEHGRAFVRRCDRKVNLPAYVYCNWQAGEVFLMWDNAQIPEHKIICSYEYGSFPDEPEHAYIIETAAVTVNWLKEGF